jgi:hypothetical protein
VQRHEDKRRAERLAKILVWQLQWQIQVAVIQSEYSRALDRQKIELAKWQAKQAQEESEFYARLCRIDAN